MQQLSNKSIDETEVERDFRVRKRVKGIFNKTESEFSSSELFKDYEEMVEDLIFNLVNGTNVDDTNAAIEKYKQKNAEKITYNQLRKNEELKRESTNIKEDEDVKKQHDLQFQVQKLPLFDSPTKRIVISFPGEFDTRDGIQTRAKASKQSAYAQGKFSVMFRLLPLTGSTSTGTSRPL